MRRKLSAVCIIISIVLLLAIINKNRIYLDQGSFISGIKDSEQEETYIIVYFSDNNGIYLIPEVRSVKLGSSSIEEKIISELIKGPQSKELLSEIPEGTRVISVKEKDGVANINFNKVFKDAVENTEESKDMLIASIVNSLTEIPSIKSVQFMIEGQKWGKPFKRIRNAMKRENMNPTEVLRKQMTLEKRGDWLNSYLLMSDSENSKGRKYYDEYIKEIKEAKDEGLLNAEFEVGDFFIDSGDSNRAAVKINFIIKNPDGTLYKSPDIYFNTIKVDGYWKVDWLVGEERN